jgi:hypothetical protein
MTTKQPHGPTMTLGNMRALGVASRSGFHNQCAELLLLLRAMEGRAARPVP